MLNWQPHFSITRVTRASGTAEAPDMIVLVLDMSRVLESGCSKTAMSIVGTIREWVP